MPQQIYDYAKRIEKKQQLLIKEIHANKINIKMSKTIEGFLGTIVFLLILHNFMGIFFARKHEDNDVCWCFSNRLGCWVNYCWRDFF